MQHRNVNGFTLIELLVAIGIIAMALGYFSQLLYNKYERKAWDHHINDFLTLNRAITLYYIDNDGQWPNQPEDPGDPCDINQIGLDLQGYIGAMDFSKFAFDCELATDEDSFQVGSVDLSDEEAAAYIAGNLPTASQVDDEVVMYIPRARKKITNLNFVSETTTSGGNGHIVEFDQPDCPNPQISVWPEATCTTAGEPLEGFRVTVDTGWSASGDVWEVWLRARTDSSGYQNIDECEGAPIRFNAFTFCQEL